MWYIVKNRKTKNERRKPPALFVYRFSLMVFLLFPAHAQKNLNLALVKRDAQIFEGIVNNVLKQNFSDPYALTGDPKGTYLQGYGVVVSFHLNINRASIRTPFGDMEATKSERDRTKEEKIRRVKESMVQCLADYGATIKQLGGHDRITISAHVEDRNELDPTKNRTILVFTAGKDDIDLYAMKKLSFDKFKERVHLLEY